MSDVLIRAREPGRTIFAPSVAPMSSCIFHCSLFFLVDDFKLSFVRAVLFDSFAKQALTGKGPNW
jgi:hypothetical protein